MEDIMDTKFSNETINIEVCGVCLIMYLDPKISLVFVDSIDVRFGDFYTKITINPSIRLLLAPFLTKIDGSKLPSTIRDRSIRIGSKSIYVRFDSNGVIWVLKYINYSILGNRSFTLRCLYPLVLCYDNIVNKLNSVLENIDLRRPGDIRYLLEATIDSLIPYRLYYHVPTEKGERRVSMIILDIIKQLNVTPITAMQIAFKTVFKPTRKSFGQYGMENDALITYLLMREVMPPYLIYPAQKIYAEIKKHLKERSENLEIIFLEESKPLLDKIYHISQNVK